MRYYRYTLDDLEKSASRKRFTYISFFAGGGGSSAGYKLAGGDCRFVNEFQQVAVDTYLANWPGTSNICGDIKNITGQQIMEMTGIQKYELDILDGSPPCPPFSMSGTKKKGWNKEKMAYGMKQKNIEDLTWEMIRIAGEMMPKVIICENVKGLTMEYAKQHLDRMVTDFEALGYTTTYKVLNGIHFGVPQKRQRVFIISVRNDVLDDIEMPWMLISSLFPEGVMNEEPTIEDAIGDLRFIFHIEKFKFGLNVPNISHEVHSRERNQTGENPVTVSILQIFGRAVRTNFGITDLNVNFVSDAVDWLVKNYKASPVFDELREYMMLQNSHTFFVPDTETYKVAIPEWKEDYSAPLFMSQFNNVDRNGYKKTISASKQERDAAYKLAQKDRCEREGCKCFEDFVTNPPIGSEEFPLSEEERLVNYKMGLQVDHVDRNLNNIAPENLKTYCPNAHSGKTMKYEDYMPK